MVKKDLILKMTPENKRKTFHNQTKAWLLTQRNHWIKMTHPDGKNR